MKLLQDFKFGYRDTDSWKCNFQTNGLFSLSRLKLLIDEKLLPNSLTAYETERNNLMPQKIGVFIWRVRQNRIPVRTKLEKRGIDLDSLRCPVCDNDIETVDHILLHCSFAKDVWNMVYRWWNIGNMSHLNLERMFCGIKYLNRPNISSKVWQAIEWFTGYSIWLNRNQTIFRKKKGIGPTVLNEIQIKTFEWISKRSWKFKLEWSQWLINPSSFDEHG
ncbi:uncharacterized protein [Rutidosis leptorrhynchoides]|uniref:uncharacterized protein n=1 Tax=Rutidosis leptorrhynchoides TaxID=125765 RepID=UPI003A9993D2